MSQKATTITLDPRPVKVGAEWQIKATHPSGHIEMIVGFRTSPDAVDWISGPQSRAWIKAGVIPTKADDQEQAATYAPSTALHEAGAPARAPLSGSIPRGN